VIPVAFDYVRPSTVDEALTALRDAGDEAKVLAGGQSLIPVLRLRMAAPGLLVDLGGIGELRGVRDDGDALVIGSMTTHATLAGHPLVAEHAPLLAKAAVQIGDRQVRHLGTLGGSLAHADPAGDLPAVARAMDATFVVAGPGGRRSIPAAEWPVDYFTTAIAPDELLVEVRVPKYDGWGAHYEKFHRTAQAWAIVGVAAMVRRSNGSIAEARVALTNMGPTPVRATAVEQALAGARPAAQEVGAAAEHAAEGTRPPSDLSGTAEYRAHLARVLTARAVLAAC
jgi:aerobic carbon-monoxide dehydrogenase medium subunit